MKKNNFTLKIFLLITVGIISSTNFFAFAAINTSQDSSGNVNSYSSSAGFQMNTEIGAPAVGTSRSSHYIFDHGAYWDQYSPDTNMAPGRITNSNNTENGNQVVNNTSTSTSNETVINTSENSIASSIETIKNNCVNENNCISIATITEVYIINSKVLDIAKNTFVTTFTSKVNLGLIYLLILLIIILILILIILYIEKKHFSKNIGVIEKYKYGQ